MPPLTPSENRLKILLQIWMIVFLGAAVIFLFHGQTLLNEFNRITDLFHLPFEPLPQASEKFWLALSLSLMITLVFLCYWGQKDIHTNHFVVVPILVSKFTSTFFYFVFLVSSHRALAYFIGCVADGFVFLVTYSFYHNLKKDLR